MSASEVSTVHIDAMVTAGLRGHYAGGRLRWYWSNPTQGGELSRETAGYAGAMLIAENRRSVNHCYSEDEIEAPYVHTWAFPKAGWVAVLKAIDCYVYQSCEHKGWESSEARAFCDALRKHAISKLEGYEDAPWELCSSDVRGL